MHKARKAHLITMMVGLFFSSQLAMAQSTDATTFKRHKYTVYVGAGPNYYFNNLVKLHKYVHELNYSFGGRIMWEPEHLLSLGFETGYYKLYSMDLPSPVEATISNIAIPFMGVISMKFLKHYYFNFSMGRSLILNKVDTPASNFDASVLSLADFGTTLGYRYRTSDRITLCGEAKVYHASNAVDTNIAVMFMVGYGFK